MSLIGGLVQEIFGQLAAVSAGALAERPRARLATAVRRRVTLPAVILAWALVSVAMIFGWRLGLRTASTVGQLFAVLLWIGGPINALIVTDLWRNRRDA